MFHGDELRDRDREIDKKERSKIEIIALLLFFSMYVCKIRWV